MDFMVILSFLSQSWKYLTVFDMPLLHKTTKPHMTNLSPSALTLQWPPQQPLLEMYIYWIWWSKATTNLHIQFWLSIAVPYWPHSTVFVENVVMRH